MADSPAPATAAAVIDMLKDRGVLSEVGINVGHARTMKARGAIPQRWHHRIAMVARRHALPISDELLDSLAPAPKVPA